MTTYLIRRFIQMIFVVLLSTMAIYGILNLAPGGPMAGLNQIGDRKQRFSESDRARLEAYLGLDKPFVLRYITWLLGDDWLGADYMYLGLRAPDDLRFFAADGMAYVEGGYPMWVDATMTSETATYIDSQGNSYDLPIYEASKIWIRPEEDEPEDSDVMDASIIEVVDGMIAADITSTVENVYFRVSSETEWVAYNAPAWPEGSWINISWLTGQYGLLSNWSHFHGDDHGILRLDFGTSWSVARGQQISKMIESRLGNTINLMLTSTVVSLLIAVPIGILSAVKQYSRLDYVVTTFTFFGTAMPVFWMGLMLILVFSIKFREWGIPYLPAGGMDSLRTPPEGTLLRALNITPGDFVDRVVHLILPTITLSLYNMAGWSRYMRASMLDVLRQDYVRTARAKGLAERIVIVKHAMRNALIPIVTIIVFTIPGVFSGATITETIFSWPGMGRLYFNALGADDWPLVMVFLFITAILTVIATLTGDILYTVVDPRIRYD